MKKEFYDPETQRRNLILDRLEQILAVMSLEKKSHDMLTQKVFEMGREIEGLKRGLEGKGVLHQKIEQETFSVRRITVGKSQEFIGIEFNGKLMECHCGSFIFRLHETPLVAQAQCASCAYHAVISGSRMEVISNLIDRLRNVSRNSR